LFLNSYGEFMNLTYETCQKNVAGPTTSIPKTLNVELGGTKISARANPPLFAPPDPVVSEMMSLEFIFTLNVALYGENQLALTNTRAYSFATVEKILTVFPADAALKDPLVARPPLIFVVIAEVIISDIMEYS
jgi:hypothetical protein